MQIFYPQVCQSNVCILPQILLWRKKKKKIMLGSMFKIANSDQRRKAQISSDPDPTDPNPSLVYDIFHFCYSIPLNPTHWTFNSFNVTKNTQTHLAHSRHQGLWSGRVFWQGLFQIGALRWQTHSHCPRQHFSSSEWRPGQRQETALKWKKKTKKHKQRDIRRHRHMC